jgi:hypothetical protein
MKTTAPKADDTAPRNTMDRSWSANLSSWRKNKTMQDFSYNMIAEDTCNVEERKESFDKACAGSAESLYVSGWRLYF